MSISFHVDNMPHIKHRAKCIIHGRHLEMVWVDIIISKANVDNSLVFVCVIIWGGGHIGGCCMEKKFWK